MKKRTLNILRVLSLIAVIGFVIIYEAMCDQHGTIGHLHAEDIFKSINHWIIHLSACIIVCETFHNWWNK